MNNIDALVIDNVSMINIVDIIKIDDRLWGRFDLIMNKYYQGRMELLPLLMSFNGIADVTEVNIGQFIEIPDIQSLEQNVSVNTILDDNIVPGIMSTTNNLLINQQKTLENLNKNKTNAMPKLGITLKHVSYNKDTGEVIF